jgi:hypothetical protein
MLRQPNHGRTVSVLFVLCCEFGEKAGDPLVGLISAELDASTVCFAKPTDEHPHDLQRRMPMLGYKRSKIISRHGLRSQRFEGHCGRQARRWIKGRQLADEFPRAPNAEE